MWTAPGLQGLQQHADRIACDHMSGLLSRSDDRCQDGVCDNEFQTGERLGVAPLGPTECLMSRIDRSHTICCFSSKLRPQRETLIALTLNSS
jgi:hypothetical protein